MMPFEAGKLGGLGMASIDCLAGWQEHWAEIHAALLHALQR